MNYYERHIGDYLKDTSHLSLLEHGVYTRLMDVYYTREGPIPAADAARLIGARSKDERAALAAVLAEFFKPIDEAHTQDRCDREIERFQDKQRKAKASADARWGAQRSQSDGNANASPDAMRTHSEGNADGMPRAPVPSNQSPVTNPRSKASSAARGTRLPPDWSPGDSGMTFAAKHGLINGVAQAELDKFRDHWAAKPGKDGTALDWDAKWRTWCRNALEFRGKGKPADDRGNLFEGNR